VLLVVAFAVQGLSGCGSGKSGDSEDAMKIVFLHHSIGEVIWRGGVKKWFKTYNKENGTNYKIKERAFPAESPYGWNNFPYDYWNIWVKHAGNMREPTLELLTSEYDVVVFKHCYPVSSIQPDTGTPAIDSQEKRIENYVLQYNALKEKLHQFPETKFLVWTGAAQVRAKSNEEEGLRARKWAEWVKNEWDEPGDNIFVWDFFELETEGGLFLSEEHANGPRDSHPNKSFAKAVAPDLCGRIVDVIEGRGDSHG
jgi:hypothetical protein